MSTDIKINHALKKLDTNKNLSNSQYNQFFVILIRRSLFYRLKMLTHYNDRLSSIVSYLAVSSIYDLILFMSDKLVPEIFSTKSVFKGYFKYF